MQPPPSPPISSDTLDQYLAGACPELEARHVDSWIAGRAGRRAVVDALRSWRRSDPDTSVWLARVKQADADEALIAADRRPLYGHPTHARRLGARLNARGAIAGGLAALALGAVVGLRRSERRRLLNRSGDT